MTAQGDSSPRDRQARPLLNPFRVILCRVVVFLMCIGPVVAWLAVTSWLGNHVFDGRFRTPLAVAYLATIVLLGVWLIGWLRLFEVIAQVATGELRPSRRAIGAYLAGEREKAPPKEPLHLVFSLILTCFWLPLCVLAAATMPFGNYQRGFGGE